MKMAGYMTDNAMYMGFNVRGCACVMIAAAVAGCVIW